MNINNITVDDLKSCVNDAINDISYLPENFKNINGPNSYKIRCLQNNLAHLLEKDLNYMEVGVEKGTGFCSTLYNVDFNHAYAIDNWAGYEPDCENKFLSNVKKHIPEKVNNISYINKSCWDLKTEDIKHKINMYFYDAEHWASSQEAAITHLDHFLDDFYLLLIDDWNSPYVKIGTNSGILRMGHEIVFEQEFVTESNGTLSGAGNRATWWNGFYVALIKKQYKSFSR